MLCSVSLSELGNLLKGVNDSLTEIELNEEDFKTCKIKTFKGVKSIFLSINTKNGTIYSKANLINNEKQIDIFVHFKDLKKAFNFFKKRKISELEVDIDSDYVNKKLEKFLVLYARDADKYEDFSNEILEERIKIRPEKTFLDTNKNEKFKIGEFEKETFLTAIKNSINVSKKTFINTTLIELNFSKSNLKISGYNEIAFILNNLDNLYDNKSDRKILIDKEDLNYFYRIIKNSFKRNKSNIVIYENEYFVGFEFGNIFYVVNKIDDKKIKEYDIIKINLIEKYLDLRNPIASLKNEKLLKKYKEIYNKYKVEYEDSYKEKPFSLTVEEGELKIEEENKISINMCFLKKILSSNKDFFVFNLSPLILKNDSTLFLQMGINK